MGSKEQALRFKILELIALNWLIASCEVCDK